MINHKLLDNLTTAIETWDDENCQEHWWSESIGYVSDDSYVRLATICILTLEESKLGQELMAEE